MQSFTNIQDTATLTASRDLLLNNDKTAISCNSGTAFPTTNLEIGMLCYRTDLKKIYELIDTVPTWIEIVSISTPSSSITRNTNNTVNTVVTMGKTYTLTYNNDGSVNTINDGISTKTCSYINGLLGGIV